MKVRRSGPKSAPECSLNTSRDGNFSNAVPIDEAPEVELKPGVRGRYGLCPTSRLAPNPHHARIHSKRQLQKLARSIEVAGPLSPAVVDERWVVLAGHARLEAAKQSGAEMLPVVQVLGLTDVQKRIYAIADNRIAEDGRWDREKLALELPELTLLLKDTEFEISDIGFEVAEIDQIAIDFEDSPTDPADEIAPALLNGSPILRTGDLIQLGNHKLLVGEARDETALDRLMAGEKASAAFLDVPYNVRVRDIVGRGRVQHEEFDFASGEMTGAGFVAFLQSALGNAARVSRQGAVHFVCIDWKHVVEVLQASDAVYGARLNIVVWNKTNAGQGGLYRSQHELIPVFRVGDEPHLDNVLKGKFGNRSNVWTYPGVNSFRSGRLEDLASHPTVKPWKLVADALKDVTKRGDLVLDTFVGSGTTILAAERIGRHARAVEIKPKYADIVVRRWEQLTGRDAVHVETELTFADLAKERTTSPTPRVRTRRL